ncbi:hypothetical protein N658DRAFT_278744 [Parathielavia hyrcaniae]|uniref:Uncharacterized protein n=1 Tax=Parathielavia hyrcaniae TaxID=113614 RepID=A0AAN6Q4U4_9PEZI|nr:hypothetical protein N658DRAFT_278744 [Parathielavia hyrcaniae]
MTDIPRNAVEHQIMFVCMYVCMYVCVYGRSATRIGRGDGPDGKMGRALPGGRRQRHGRGRRGQREKESAWSSHFLHFYCLYFLVATTVKTDIAFPTCYTSFAHLWLMSGATRHDRRARIGPGKVGRSPWSNTRNERVDSVGYSIGLYHVSVQREGCGCLSDLPPCSVPGECTQSPRIVPCTVAPLPLPRLVACATPDIDGRFREGFDVGHDDTQ